uniref:Centromere protein S n=1 Tax=Kalanchoe fedtschenkoi TaxID=63787 RepID=A0A7N0UST4_KALFE
MDDDDMVREHEEDEEDDSEAELLRDRFRLSVIAIAEAEAKKNKMEISVPIVACVSDLAVKYADQLARGLELFAHHAGRKTVNMEDVVLSAHRNENLLAMVRSLRDEMKAKEPQSERKSKKAKRKDDTATNSASHTNI